MDPANLLANKCTPNARLRLIDLRGESDDGSGTNSSSSQTQSGTWGGSFSSVNKCHWEDLDASRGDQPIGTAAISEGNLLLLQDTSQPLKQLTAAAEACISGGGSGSGASGDAAAAATTAETCSLADVGSWYAGGASGSPKSPTAGTLALPANDKSSASSYSFKPKERALRIRTRRDRLEEGRVVAAAAAAAAAAATAAAAASAKEGSPVEEEDAQGCSAAGTSNARGGGSRSPGALSDVTVGDAAPVESLSSGEETVAMEGGRRGQGRRGASPLVGSPRQGQQQHGDAMGQPEDGSFEDLWGVAEGVMDGDDAWGVASSERDAYAGLGGGEEDTTMPMHSEAEVAEAGGSSQFDDLAA